MEKPWKIRRQIHNKHKFWKYKRTLRIFLIGYRIQPTGIISAPSFQISTPNNRITGNPDEETTYQLTIHKKNPDNKILRCHLENLIKDKGTAAEEIIPIADRAYITYNNNEIEIKTAYEETINIGRNTKTNMKLTIRTPANTPEGEYKGKLTCLAN